MPFTIYAQMKKLGKPSAQSVSPTPFTLDEKPSTVRELITNLAILGAKDYNSRKEDGQILGLLTQKEIDAQAARGKISFGAHEGSDASLEDAAVNAVQCFQDGIYRIFAADQELTDLDQPIPWTDSTIFTFIRLTMLSGW